MNDTNISEEEESLNALAEYQQRLKEDPEWEKFLDECNKRTVGVQNETTEK